MHVVITGANRGIGQELAKHFEAAGAEVTKTSRSPRDGYSTLDVTDPASHCAFAGELGDRAVDLLVCNAGVYLDKFQQFDGGFAADLWAQTFATNVSGVFQTIQALMPNVQRASTPKIAIISSEMASTARSPGGSYIYRASKAAVLNMGRNLASDFKDQGVAIGIYHPGWVVTDMGGTDAPVAVQDSAAGLLKRFEALSLETTGVYEDFRGDALPF